MQRLKNLVPAGVKLKIRCWLRRWQDWRSGLLHRMARADKTADITAFPFFMVEEQPVRANPLSANNVHNIELAVHSVTIGLIEPGQVFSFWQLVGLPSEKKGYKKGRTIRNNQIEEVTGGGLCQLSGMIYLLALRAGMQIQERHAHSMDIYKEEERFAPLGSDATIAYGYKDLRFINNSGHPVCFSFHTGPEKITAFLRSTESLPVYQPGFECHWQKDTVTVQTSLQVPGGQIKQLHSTIYKRLYPGT